LKGIYESILICLKDSRKVDLHYLCEKLHIFQCKTIYELTSSIEEISEQIEDSTIIGFGVDLLFRSLYSALESRKINLANNDIEFIRSSLEFFIEIHDREILIEKYALDFITG